MLKYIIFALAITQILSTGAGSYEEKNVNQFLLEANNDASYALARSEIDKLIEQDYTFLRVDYVAIQIVAGENIKYQITYENESNTQTYEVIIFNQPWTKTLQVTSIQLLGQHSNNL